MSKIIAILKLVWLTVAHNFFQRDEIFGRDDPPGPLFFLGSSYQNNKKGKEASKTYFRFIFGCIRSCPIYIYGLLSFEKLSIVLEYIANDRPLAVKEDYVLTEIWIDLHVKNLYSVKLEAKITYYVYKYELNTFT